VPDRVLRVWALLGNAADDSRQAARPAEVIARLGRQLDAAARTGRRGRTYASNQRRSAR
jgi:hypothetical protein